MERNRRLISTVGVVRFMIQAQIASHHVMPLLSSTSRPTFIPGLCRTYKNGLGIPNLHLRRYHCTIQHAFTMSPVLGIRRGKISSGKIFQLLHKLSVQAASFIYFVP